MHNNVALKRRPALVHARCQGAREERRKGDAVRDRERPFFYRPSVPSACTSPAPSVPHSPLWLPAHPPPHLCGYAAAERERERDTSDSLSLFADRFFPVLVLGFPLCSVSGSTALLQQRIYNAARAMQRDTAARRGGSAPRAMAALRRASTGPQTQTKCRHSPRCVAPRSLHPRRKKPKHTRISSAQSRALPPFQPVVRGRCSAKETLLSFNPHSSLCVALLPRTPCVLPRAQPLPRASLLRLFFSALF